MTPSRVIGKDGTLPWHLPADLTFFKQRTAGHPVVMGRRTQESIGRPLPGRRNIVLTRNRDWSRPNIETIHHPANLAELDDLHGTVYIIGGAEIYAAFEAQLAEWIVSHIHQEYPGDTYLPPFHPRFRHQEILFETPDFTARRHFSDPAS